MDATVKKKIGKYEITGILGRGGMGVVYRAEDKRIGRQVAIKTLTEGFSGEPEMLERFYREAQAGILQHPNIVIVFDLGDEDGTPFIVMEFVNGEPLDKIISSGLQLPLIDKLTIIEQVCSALGYAHQQGVIHRDIKPANVMVQRDPILAKIVDFGIARVQSSKESGLTRTGNVIGTIHYIAPERLRGQPFDGRSDIFATGIMLYLLLTGQLPFTGEDMAVAQKLVNEPHPPLSTWLSSYPKALDGVLDRALAKDPDRRYSTAEEFAADLHSIGDELKKGQVVELFTDAERLAREEQFGRARELLFQLVKIDPQHTSARQLLGVVNQNLERMQRAEQVRQLLGEAEEAIASSRFAEALNALDQATKYDPDNADLKARIEATREKKRRHDEIGTLMNQAGSMRDRGDWTGALKVVEKALSLDQQDTGIRAAYAEIARQAKLVAQQGQIREMLGKAKTDISSRRFTAAIEILREVAKIDPSLPEAETLLQTAVSAQEQERRRQILDKIQAEIESCLQNEEYDRAAEQVDRALEKLPAEPALLQLKTRIAIQAKKIRVRQQIDATAAKAQEAFLQSPGEALLIVQRAIQELGAEERLLALEDSIRQRLKSAEKEEVRGRYLREAQGAIDRSQFDKAVEILESYQLEFADAAGVEELLEFAKSELAQQQRRERIAACIAQGRTLMQEERFAEAVKLLEPASAESGDPSLARLLEEVRGQQREAERKAEALVTRITRLRERGQLDEAIGLLQGIPAAAVSGTQLNTLLTALRTEQGQKQAKEKALAAASQALEKGNFQAAIESLQSVQRAWGESAELTKAIAEIESRRAAFATEAVGKAVEAARAALVANDPAAAIRELKGVAELFEFAAAAQQADWKRLNAEAGKPQVRRTGQVPQVSDASTQFTDEAPRNKMLVPLVAGGLLLVVVAGAAFWFLQPKKTDQAANGPVVTTNPTGGSSQPMPASGTLVVQGNVEGVQVLVDGLIKGFTQADKTLKVPLDPGPHSIKFTKPGYLDSKPSQVTITANNQTPLPFTLTPSGAGVPAETMGYLTIHSTPQAVVKIDGAVQGNTDGRGDLIVQVKPGGRTLEIGLAGYQTSSQSFNIKVGERVNLMAMLNPVPQPKAPDAPRAQPVQILSFAASTNQIDQGGSATLKWQTANATEVSIDNGSGSSRVQNNGESSVSPANDTTYLLTAKGSDGNTTQKLVNISVKRAPDKPAPVVVNNAPQAVDQTSLVVAALNNFKGAYNAHDLARLQAAWAMPAPVAKTFQTFFKGYPNSKVADDCPSGALSIAGDSANWTCTETTTLDSSSKPQSHPMHFTFAKKNGAWTITDRR